MNVEKEKETPGPVAMYILLDNGMQIVGKCIHEDEDLIVLITPYRMFGGTAMPLSEILLSDETEYPYSRDIIIYNEKSDRIKELFNNIHTKFKAAKSGIQMAGAANNLHLIKPGKA